jgi:hypothetical protein
MNHTNAIIVEPLETRLHLSSAPIAVAPHAAPLTPPQQAQVNAALIAAFTAGFDSAMAVAAQLAPLPASAPGTDALTALSSPDFLDQLVSSSITTDTSPILSAPSNTSNSLLAGVPSPFSIAALTIAPSSLNFG